MIIRWILILFIVVITCISAPRGVLCLSVESIVDLKSAGVSDATIELIIAEKSIETAAFSVAEIIAMKNAGIGDRTLQAAIRAGSFLRRSDPIVYGRAIRPIRLSSVDDIIEMHREGFSDAVLEAVLTVVTPSADTERQRAFEMLERMNIRVHLRGE